MSSSSPHMQEACVDKGPAGSEGFTEVLTTASGLEELLSLARQRENGRGDRVLRGEDG